MPQVPQGMCKRPAAESITCNHITALATMRLVIMLKQEWEVLMQGLSDSSSHSLPFRMLQSIWGCLEFSDSR